MAETVQADVRSGLLSQSTTLPVSVYGRSPLPPATFSSMVLAHCPERLLVVPHQ
jgi:hypothetical protein